MIRQARSVRYRQANLVFAWSRELQSTANIGRFIATCRICRILQTARHRTRYIFRSWHYGVPYPRNNIVIRVGRGVLDRERIINECIIATIDDRCRCFGFTTDIYCLFRTSDCTKLISNVGLDFVVAGLRKRNIYRLRVLVLRRIFNNIRPMVHCLEIIRHEDVFAIMLDVIFHRRVIGIRRIRLFLGVIRGVSNSDRLVDVIKSLIILTACISQCYIFYTPNDCRRVIICKRNSVAACCVSFIICRTTVTISIYDNRSAYRNFYPS